MNVDQIKRLQRIIRIDLIIYGPKFAPAFKFDFENMDSIYKELFFCCLSFSNWIKEPSYNKKFRDFMTKALSEL